MEQAVDLSDCPGGLDSSPGNPVVARKETNVAEDRRVFVHLVRHGEASHNKAVRNRLPGLSRSSIFKSAEHFDSRLSPVGRAQCIDAAERMPRSLCDALRSFYLCESRKLREEENGGDFQTRRIGHYKGGDDSRVEQSLCPGKSDEESEGIYGQNLSTFHKESQSVLSHSAHTQTSQKRVILLASTLRRSLETAHLVLSHAVQLIEHGDMNANVSEREDDADESIPTAAARSDSFRSPLSPEVRTDVRNRFERSLPESPRDPNNELSTGYPGRPSSAISDGADGEAECVTERSLLEVHNHSDRRLSESPISEDNDCQVVGKEKDRCEGAAGISSTEAGTIETVEEAERGVLDIPVHSLESMREWSGGGHVCDGRVSVDDLRDFCRPRFRSVSFEVDSNEDPLPPSMPRESRQDVERRCLSFLRTLFRVASRESPVLGVTTTPEGRAGHREEEKKAWDITAERRSTLPVEELTGSEVARPSLSSTTASHDVHVVCVVHSAWTRHLFALLGLFDPSRRGLKNCEWRSFTTSLRGIHAAINTLSSVLFGANVPPDEHCFPLLLPRRVVQDQSCANSIPLGTSVGENSSPGERKEDREPRKRVVRCLNDFLQSVPKDVFSFLVFPPPPASLALSPCHLTSEKSETPTAAAKEIQRGSSAELLFPVSAYQRIAAWCRKHRYLPSDSRGNCLDLQGSTMDAVTSALIPKEDADCLRKRLEELRVLKTEQGQRAEIATDAMRCLSPVTNEGETSKWEVVAKERVHRQTCVLLVLPASPRSGESGTRASPGQSGREDEIAEICQQCLPTTAGAVAVYRVDVQSL